MKHVVCVGVAVVDAIYSVPAIPAEPVKVMASAYEEVGGGMAATGAVAIVRLGGSAAMWARVGADALGARVIEGLAAEGVDARAIRRLPGRVSTRATVLVDPTGERLLAGYADPELETDPSWLPMEAIGAADAVLADQSWTAGAARTLEAARARGIPSVLDFDGTTDAAAPALVAQASHTVFSEVALTQLTGETSLEAGLARASALTDGLVGVTAGARGFAWRAADGSRGAVPAAEVEVVDTLGAGDVFHGAYALGLAEGMDLERCARFATAAAALKCTRPGGRAGAPTREEVERFLALGRVPKAST